MLLALVAMAALPDLVPARWPSNDPSTLGLLKASPVNCLLLEHRLWSKRFNDEAASRGIMTMAVIHPQDGGPPVLAQQALDSHFGGVVLEGVFDSGERSRIQTILDAGHVPLIELTPRAEMPLDGSRPLIGTTQGLWPGVQIQDDGHAKAAPSGAPWIDTNSGFLRFVRASTPSIVWIANQPPPGAVFPVSRYIQAVADAAMVGARWVLAFDDDFARKLAVADKTAVAGFQRIGAVLAFYEAHKEWREGRPYGKLALVEDAESGALLSGGVLDMIATKHTPVLPVPKSRLNGGSLQAAQMAVNVDPDSLSGEQKEVLRAFTRSGGTLLTGPPGWKFPAVKKDQIVLDKDDLKKLDDIWREMNSMTGRRNLGARLFNVSSMLSSLQELPERREILIHLVNYSDFPVENITVHVLGKYKVAKLLLPDSRPATIEGYEVEDGTGFDVDHVGTVGVLVLQRTEQ